MRAKDFIIKKEFVDPADDPNAGLTRNLNRIQCLINWVKYWTARAILDH